MSKIKLEQIGINEVEVRLPSDTPMEMVGQLKKGLEDRGLVEDLAKSTLSTRYFYRPEDKANDVADQLIKSLQSLVKDELPYWHPKAQMENQRRVREMDVADRRAKLGVKQPTNVSTKPEPLTMPDTPSIKAPAAPAAPSPAAPAVPKGPSTLPGITNRVYDPAMSGTYQKSEGAEHVKGCQCEKCLAMEKSGYGPKGAGQYSAEDNARRKANNVGDAAGEGPNVNVKAYSSKPGQPSAKQSAALTARIQNAANKKQPVKHLSPEEIAAQYPGQMKKSWGQHLPFPSAEEEIAKFAKEHVQQGDDALANQLATMMNSKAMLNPTYRQPSSEDMIMAGEQMGLGVDEKMVKTADKDWGNTINNWLVEATKPISQRFASEAEELAYWSKIKVAGGSNDEPGY